MMARNIESAIQRLKAEKIVLGDAGKQQPVILWKNNHWHLLSVGFVVDEENAPCKGIVAVHFMNAGRARKTIAEWLPYCPFVAYSKVTEDFEYEVQVKVLPNAEEYRPLLLEKQAVIVAGYTSDTLREVKDPRGNIDNMVTILGKIMEAGRMGPFLRFTNSAKRILNPEGPGAVRT
jgi:hypothetical protein